MNPFSKIPMYRPKRNIFRMTKNVRTTANIGEIIVSYAREMVPGDTFYMSQIGSCEFMPSIAPFKGDIELESCAFFVPYDMLDIPDDHGKFSDILLSMRDVQDTVPVPKWHFDDVTKDTVRGSLWDYCSFPTDLKTKPDESIMPLAYLQRAYNHIYNEYIRDENIDDEIPLTNNKIQTICYKKDMFTTASKEPQLGVAPRMQLRGSAFAKWSEDIIGQIVGYLATYSELTKSTTSGGQKYEAGSQFTSTINASSPNLNGSTVQGIGNASTDVGIKVNKQLIDLLNDNSIDLSNLITFNIEDLRVLNRLQKWLERNAVCGARYKEYLIANYGLAPNDETLDRPAFIGRVKTPVLVNTVTNSTSGGDTFQGSKTGNAVGVNGGNFGKWLAKEFGIVMVLSWLRPKAQYSQGISRQWIKDSVFDFFNPIFEGLGMQPIQNCELYVDGSANDKKIIGYTDRYNDMRTDQDAITGYLRGADTNSLEVWTVQRKFSSHPSLTPEFLHVDKKDYDYLFAIDTEEHPEAPQAVLTFTNIVKAIRPIHKYNMTHF